MKRGTESGVTLMEVLVAMTLLSLLSVGILFAMRIGLSSMERANNRFTSNRLVLGVERAITAQIAGYMPVRADCRVSPEGPVQTVPFFQGERQTMRFVSTYSLNQAWRSTPHILEFQVIPGEGGQGVRLVVNELVYSGPISAGRLCLGRSMDPLSARLATIFRPVETGSQSFVLADKLASCSFAFREERQPPLTPIWLPRWSGDRSPSAVRIDMMPLALDPGKLQIPSIVAPLHADRDPLGRYGDRM